MLLPINQNDLELAVLKIRHFSPSLYQEFMLYAGVCINNQAFRDEYTATTGNQLLDKDELVDPNDLTKDHEKIADDFIGYMVIRFLAGKEAANSDNLSLLAASFREVLRSRTQETFKKD